MQIKDDDSLLMTVMLTHPKYTPKQTRSCMSCVCPSCSPFLVERPVLRDFLVSQNTNHLFFSTYLRDAVFYRSPASFGVTFTRILLNCSWELFWSMSSDSLQDRLSLFCVLFSLFVHYSLPWNGHSIDVSNHFDILVFPWIPTKSTKISDSQSLFRISCQQK